mgnify:CR=1 FL=1
MKIQNKSFNKFKLKTYNLVGNNFFSLKNCTSILGNSVIDLTKSTNSNKIFYKQVVKKTLQNTKLIKSYNIKINNILSKTFNYYPNNTNSVSTNKVHNSSVNLLPVYVNRTDLNDPLNLFNNKLPLKSTVYPLYNQSFSKKPKKHLTPFRSINFLNYQKLQKTNTTNYQLSILPKFAQVKDVLITKPLNIKTNPYLSQHNQNKHYKQVSKLYINYSHLTVKTNPLLSNVTNMPLIYLLLSKINSTKNIVTDINQYKLPKFTSRTHNKMTLVNLGLFILKNLNLLNSINSTKYKYLYKLKKSLYSFTKPNQVKNTILRRKSSVVFYKLIFLNRGNNYRSKLFTNFKKTNLIKSYFSENFKLNNYLLFKPGHKINTPSSPTREVRLGRVRFKPGYQRLWRDSRTALKDLLNLKFIYQKQLTRYLVRFYKKTNQSTLSPNELQLSKLSIYSRLVPDHNTFTLFYNSNLFFINGLSPTNKDIVCVLNDFIQLVVSKWYYIFYRWLAHWTLVRFRKIKRLVYRKGLSSRYKVMKSRKQKSNTVPDWIFSTKYDFSDVKSFIEVDYFTLSFYVIYEPYFNYYHPPTNILSPKVNIYRLYNWKYIT